MDVQEPGTEGESPYVSPESAPYGAEPPDPIEQDKDARTMGMLCHMTGLFDFLHHSLDGREQGRVLPISHHNSPH